MIVSLLNDSAISKVWSCVEFPEYIHLFPDSSGFSGYRLPFPSFCEMLAVWGMPAQYTFQSMVIRPLLFFEFVKAILFSQTGYAAVADLAGVWNTGMFLPSGMHLGNMPSHDRAVVFWEKIFLFRGTSGHSVGKVQILAGRHPMNGLWRGLLKREVSAIKRVCFSVVCNFVDTRSGLLETWNRLYVF